MLTTLKRAFGAAILRVGGGECYPEATGYTCYVNNETFSELRFV